MKRFSCSDCQVPSERGRGLHHLAQRLQQLHRLLLRRPPAVSQAVSCSHKLSSFHKHLKHFPCRQDSALSSASLNTSLSSDSGVWTEGQSPYRKYVEKLLKSKGIRKTLQLQHRETKFILHRAKVALEKTNPVLLDTDYLSTSGHHDWQGHVVVEERLNSSLPQHIKDDEEVLKEFGCSHPQFENMNLPSFRAVYLFLCRVPKVG